MNLQTFCEKLTNCGTYISNQWNTYILVNFLISNMKVLEDLIRLFYILDIHVPLYINLYISLQSFNIHYITVT